MAGVVQTAPREVGRRVNGRALSATSDPVRVEKGGILYSVEKDTANWHRYRLDKKDEEDEGRRSRTAEVRKGTGVVEEDERWTDPGFVQRKVEEVERTVGRFQRNRKSAYDEETEPPTDEETYSPRGARSRSAARKQSQQQQHSPMSYSSSPSPSRSPIQPKNYGVKDRRSVTVPAPFRGMEVAEMKWLEKCERERLEKEEKEREDRETLKISRERMARSARHGKPFKGVIERSERMMERRRLKEEEAAYYLEEELLQSDFKAKPAQIFDGDWHAVEEQKRARRAQRIEMRKAQLLRMSSMPRRMALHEAEKKMAEAEASKENKSRSAERAKSATQSSGRPARPSPAEVREQLERKQAAWERTLAAAKRASSTTKPARLPIEEREEEYRSKAQKRNAEREERARRAREEEREALRRERERLMNTPVPSAPRSTFSTMLKAQGVKNKLRDEAKKAEREAEAAAVRKRTEKENSKVVTEALRSAQRNSIGEMGNHLSSVAKAKAAGAKFRAALKENKERIKEAQNNRPSLWERHDLELRKEAARREALTSIAKSVYGGAKGWEKSAIKDSLFDEEEKAILGI